MKVLIIQTRPGIGDLCVFLPPIHAIAKNLDSAEIDILTKKRTCAKETLKFDPFIKNIHFLETFNNSNLSLINFIKKNSYDKVYIFHYGIRYPLICKIAGIKNIFFYGWFKKNENIVEKSKNACLTWLVKKDLEFPYKIYRPEITTIINDNIVIGIAGSGPTKKWPTENFIKLIEQIELIKKHKFILAGGDNEKEIAKIIKAALPKIHIDSLCNLTIEESIKFISGSKCYIGNDTGFMHICAGLSIPSYGLFGDTPINYSSYTNKIIPLSPADNKFITHGSLAMDQITVNEVLSEVKKVI